MLRKGNIIKHKAFMDVAIEITTFQQYSPNYFTVRGTWINQGFVDTYSMGHRANIKIPIGQLKDWALCLDNQDRCIRYSRWKGL